MADLSVPFPILMDGPVEQWQWPKPPFAWQHAPAPDNDVPQPCRIEAPSGAVLEGEMLAFEPHNACLKFRQDRSKFEHTVPFKRIHRLTLTVPLKSVEPRAGASIERIPATTEQREYRLQPAGDGEALSGHTAGYVETANGLYLFTPINQENSIQRVFVPRSAYTHSEFGPSAKEVAAEHWVTTPSGLLDAIELQRRKPMLPIGQSLLSLGLVTQAQLDHVLAEQSGDKPLGEMLAAAGVISRTDLQTAIAHKMGYPMVDLTRFPIDPVALRKVPLHTALECRVVPLLIDGQRMIVAMNEPSRATKLSTLHSLLQMTIVPVLAAEKQILIALGNLSQNDAWSHVNDK
ncbi:MAG: hypothetical protein OEM00_01135 [Burkholderiaceae bacterium]|nr:hypothetical protein [Burkholderiaceae bacterium]MDH3459586.1 hypothetical protein [Burkholderiaceae bacterium]